MVVNIWSFVPLGETEFIVACRTKLKSDFQRVYVLPYGRFARKAIHLTPRFIFNLLLIVRIVKSDEFRWRTKLLNFFLIYSSPLRLYQPCCSQNTRLIINTFCKIIGFTSTNFDFSSCFSVLRSSNEELKIQNDSFADRAMEYDTYQTA